MSFKPKATPVGTPSQAFSGNRAMNVQFYDESNKKLGSAWGASRRILGATAGQKFYSILKSRTLPIDLKARGFSYTGNGLIARFYTGFTPVVLPEPDPIYNLRPSNAAFRDCDIYALDSPPASLGDQWAYPLFLEGNQQNQGKGNPLVSAGYHGWIIDPNEEILLEIESLDAQNISATIVLYNGLLDLPLP